MKSPFPDIIADGESISLELFGWLQADCPQQLKRILSQKDVELEPDFLGFVGTYRLLSKMIPQHWTVIDFGCYVAAQAWYFKDHSSYIGVDVNRLKRFRFGNTTHLRMPISEAIPKLKLDLQETFAICNYVPSPEVDLVRKTFPNLYVYYPHGGSFPRLQLRPLQSL